MRWELQRFKTGKIPSNVLVRNVFPHKGAVDKSVVLGPSIGEDAALISLGKNVLVLKTDPITGAASDIGWLAVHINANDVACRGARPRWFLCDLLLPEKGGPALLNGIMRQMDKAAKQLGVAIVGGHTEVTPGLRRPILTGCMAAVAPRNRVVKTDGARPGDRIIMTKTIGIEGTAVLAADFAAKLRPKVGVKLLRKARNLTRSISVVKDALTAVQVGGVRAMHDPTEGGLMQGIWELGQASGVGFRIYESRIPILPETKEICSALKVEPLRLMSSGCLLIAAENRKSNLILRRLKAKGIRASTIGEITRRSSGRWLVTRSGRVQRVVASERDELYRVIESHRHN